MSRDSMTSKVENGRVLIIERTFDAPQALLFKVYSDAEHLKHFWGPKGWEVPFCTVDFRPGGVWLYCMKCVDKNQGQYYGMEAWGKGIYKEISAPKSISYVDYFADEKGNTNPDLPSTDILVEFVVQGNKTKLVTRAAYQNEEELKKVMEMGMMEGISQTWDRLDEHLESLKK